MDTILRKLAEWKGRRKAAQVIVFDGGAEVERARSFFRGALVGIGLSTGVFLLAAPGTTDPRLVDELNHRAKMIREADQRFTQAVQVADVCLNTAEKLERTLASYEAFLRSDSPTNVPRSMNAPAPKAAVRVP